MLSASQFTFGVEIETIAPASAIANHGLTIGGYHNGLQVAYLPTGWKAERDGSLRPGPNEYACEIVSPILKGIEGLKQVVEVCNELKAKGHRVNGSCGVHVHVGWSRDNDVASLARLVSLVSNLEESIFAATGTKNRERGQEGHSYCKSVKQYGSAVAAQRHANSDRYHVLNLTNLAYGTRQTVEFRAFSGSIEGLKIVSWVRICLGIVAMALATTRAAKFTRAAAPTGKTSGWYRATPGWTAVCYLFSKLGWNKGLTKEVYGAELVAEGLPTMDETKAELVRLARKYDAQV